MKVMILANSDVGLYQFRCEIIDRLLADRNEVVLSLPKGDFIETLTKKGCRYTETPMDRKGMNPFRDARLFLRYVKMLKKEKPDLVITYTIKPNVYGGFACRLRKIPYGVNITGLGRTFDKDGMLHKLVRGLYRVACKKAKVIFFENEENRRVFLGERMATEAQTCLLSGAGVNLEKFSWKEYPNTEPVHFLYMGRVMEQKGIGEVLEAMERLVGDGIPCKLSVVGSLEEDFREHLERCETAGWLQYFGYQKDVRPFIEKAHCVLLPSWYHEGMANTNLESAASGRPIITSTISGCREAVLDGVSGFLVEGRNSFELYQKMKEFTQLSFEARKNMGLAGRAHMEKCFDKRKVVEETIQRLYA